MGGRRCLREPCWQRAFSFATKTQVLSFDLGFTPGRIGRCTPTHSSRFHHFLPDILAGGVQAITPGLFPHRRPKIQYVLFYKQRATLPKSLPLLAFWCASLRSRYGRQFPARSCVAGPATTQSLSQGSRAFLERLGGSCICGPDAAELIKDNATTAQRLSSPPGIVPRTLGFQPLLRTDRQGGQGRTGRAEAAWGWHWGLCRACSPCSIYL